MAKGDGYIVNQLSMARLQRDALKERVAQLDEIINAQERMIKEMHELIELLKKAGA